MCRIVLAYGYYAPYPAFCDSVNTDSGPANTRSSVVGVQYYIIKMAWICG